MCVCVCVCVFVERCPVPFSVVLERNVQVWVKPCRVGDSLEFYACLVFVDTDAFRAVPERRDETSRVETWNGPMVPLCS